MIDITKKEALSYIRKSAKNAGLTFKQSTTRLNGTYLYMLVERKSGGMIMSYYNFWTAYEDACSGYIESWSTKDQIFLGF